jgi:hypothetical protein
MIGAWLKPSGVPGADRPWRAIWCAFGALLFQVCWEPARRSTSRRFRAELAVEILREPPDGHANQCGDYQPLDGRQDVVRIVPRDAARSSSSATSTPAGAGIKAAPDQTDWPKTVKLSDGDGLQVRGWPPKA